MHIEREREIMKRQATSLKQQATANTSTTFKPSISLQPPAVGTTPSASGVGAGRNLGTTPSTNSSSVSNLPKRDLKLTVRFRNVSSLYGYLLHLYLSLQRPS